MLIESPFFNTTHRPSLPVNRVIPSFLFLVVSALSQAAEAPIPAKIEFNRDIRPILSDNCYYCHGPDKNHRKAKMRLDVREEALAKEAFVPGKPDESELIKRLDCADKDDLMPPLDSNKKLTPRQKELLKQWVAQGAEYQMHWSYEKPVRTFVQPGENGVDFLVRKRLKEIGLTLAPEADLLTLIRRLYSDLLGLPPTPAEVAGFVNDVSPNAYLELVNRVLKSPHYGERMAMGWLDVVRFADTIGYHSDTPRNVWPYRDWVIKSFNDNKPFNRFTLEQVAGDLMLDADQETRIGSAFNRLLLSTEEGGAQPKDYESRMLTDRVRAIGAAWLGQTTGCCQCHDHKFDPWTQRDFYSLGAFFADIKEPIIGKREDGMVIGTPEQEEQLVKLDAALAEATKKMKAVQPQIDAAQAKWEAELAAKPPPLAPNAKDEAKAKASPVDKKLIAAIKKGVKARSKAEKELINNTFLPRSKDLFKAEREGFAKADKERKTLYDTLPKCLVTVSTEQKRTVRILPRGNWMDETGEIVQPALPHFLPGIKIEDDGVPTRLDLAKWLVSPKNPLTPRTVMNRLTKQLFGTGQSKVLDDLGAQGEMPANQAVLDWLACEFVDSGWNIQYMVRTIVASATYKQISSMADCGPQIFDAAGREAAERNLTASIERDPYNRELARQGTFRVDAELVRDNALTISGLLVPKIGGPSAKPYQPARYWENLNFP
ncbi:MAG: Planctomycete cytochrome, partial [Verrucomicrobiaceae bacterium]|nr:Planctomycete cytochrome [Verrucomicrobiaceae bacterium]